MKSEIATTSINNVVGDFAGRLSALERTVRAHQLTSMGVTMVALLIVAACAVNHVPREAPTCPAVSASDVQDVIRVRGIEVVNSQGDVVVRLGHEPNTTLGEKLEALREEGRGKVRPKMAEDGVIELMSGDGHLQATIAHGDAWLSESTSVGGIENRGKIHFSSRGGEHPKLRVMDGTGRNVCELGLSDSGDGILVVTSKYSVPQIR